MRLITTTDDLATLCRRLSTADFVTVDTEFLRDSTYWPKLCLVQLAGPDPDDVALIDPLAETIALEPLHALLADPGVLKVFHAARQDVEIFYHQAGLIPTPLFDTQVAAMVCGFGDSVGYETLVRRLADGEIDKTSRFTDWSRRPLSERQLRYAAADVTYLRTVYARLAATLAETGRAGWLDEEMAVLTDPATYALQPEEAWRRIKSRGGNRRFLALLKETAAWREEMAQRRNVPRSRILRDDVLLEIAAHPPKSPEDMNALRGIPKGFGASAMGRDLLAAVARGLALPPEALPPLERQEPLPSGLGPLVELLKVLLKLCCEAHGVAQKLVASPRDLEQIAASDTAAVPALSGWRRQIFGEQALALKAGRLALAARGRDVVVLPLAGEAAPAAPLP